ncbi:MAG: Flp pilus assembly complex ATPase component TadA [Rubrivivax sp.]|nr:Flp pilus assembly complex ATPase component TadA [Rubrivivax sp.]
MPTDTTAPDIADQRLGHSLVAAAKLAPRDLERAQAASAELGKRLPDVLVQLGLVSEADIAAARAQMHGLRLLVSDDFPAELPEVPGLQRGFLLGHHVLPLAVDAQGLHVALPDPDDAFVQKALRLATGLPLQVVLATPADIDKALAERADGADPDNAAGDAEPDSGEFVEHLRDLASEAPVIRMVNTLIGRVIELRASDIHLEPFEDGLHLRYRVDGTLATAEVIAPRLGAAVASRIKLLAHLDIAERRLPQDGRIRIRVKGRELDLRVSTVPSVHGESVVMRVLDRTAVRLSLPDMGMPDDTLALLRDMLARPHGILLVTGPTGAGKTTTLYAGLAALDAATQKIVTVEDPVEYQLPGIVQIQVHAQIGLTFANALRSILRQDPDVVMIGEMRDGETAQIAVQAALTGHLVLSTLHTNDAASAIVRLVDMGVERFLITSTVNGVVAQRLVRSLCAQCKQPFTPDPGWLQRTGLQRHLAPGAPLYEPRGCPACRGSGYRGRLGIYELLVIDDALRRAIGEGADAGTLHTLAQQRGLRPLHDDGLRRVAAGLTTLEEVLRATQDASDA